MSATYLRVVSGKSEIDCDLATAQLIDAVTGAHIWAERFDRGFVDVFAVQDELNYNVAAAIGPAMSKIVTEQATRKSDEQLAAYDHYRARNVAFSPIHG